MSTNFLDIKGKIADAQAILDEYYKQSVEANRRNDTKEVARLERLIEAQENYINGLRRRAKDLDV